MNLDDEQQIMGKTHSLVKQEQQQQQQQQLRQLQSDDFVPEHTVPMGTVRSALDYPQRSLQHSQSHYEMPTLQDQQPHLYPMMHTFTQSPSPSVSSLQSVPHNFMPSSQSENSIAASSSMNSFATSSLATPMRNRRLSTSFSQASLASPMPRGQTPSRQTPSRIVKSHRRTRSRLSLDVSGAASIVTEIDTKSPGRNPFYTPSQKHSPHITSPESTPLMKSSMYVDLDETNNVYPMMLHPADYAAAANMTFKIAEQQTSHLDASPFFLSDPSLSESAIPQTIPHFPGPQEGHFHHELRHEPQQHFTVKLENEDDATPPEPQHKPESTRHNSNPGSSSQLQHNFPRISQPLASHLSRSQSVLDLHSHITPPEITKYDILVPRKRLSKSQSATDIANLPARTDDGKKPKKIHPCPLCGGIFHRPEHLKRHMRSHSSEKPFECEACGKKFNRADNMKAHQRKIHGMDP